MSAKVVCTIGVFDMLHVGHVDFLRTAALIGDELVVGIPNDALVERLKGRAPVIPADYRADMLLALAFVDRVDVLDTTDYAAWVWRIGPDVLALGVEHTAGRFALAQRTIEAGGGKAVRIPRSPRESTTDIVRRIKERE